MPQSPPALSAARRSSRLARRDPLRALGTPRTARDSTSSDRPRATPGERYMRRTRLREQRSALGIPSAPAASAPHSFLAGSPFVLPNTHPRPRSPVVEIPSERRHKRRKLDHDSLPGTLCNGFRYGHKGQVVPGRLNMEIVSCDGGEYKKEQSLGLYSVQNVLKKDRSVYCSESPSCNLLLKHAVEGSFALDKIVIRAPDRGFTAPVQEGLVFASMSADDLIAGTWAYSLQYGSPSRQASATPDPPSEDGRLSLYEALEDPHIWQQSQQGAHQPMEERIENLRLRSHRLDLESSLRSRASRLRERPQMPDDDDLYADHCDNAVEAPYTASAQVSAPTPPPFLVTTASEDESDANEELPSAAVMADRLRRESRWRPDTDDEDDHYSPRLGPLRRAPALDYTAYNEWRERRREIEPLRASRLATPSRIEPVEPSLGPEGLITPHARFFIAKNKNTITIKFHPAISGRYVLLKLWSPSHNGNIDIESIQCYGYSGPRFFPAMQPC